MKRLILSGYIALLVVFSAIFHSKLFGWNGLIVGNLLASAYWAPLGLIHLDNLQRQHHRERMEQADRQHKQQLRAILVSKKANPR